MLDMQDWIDTACVLTLHAHVLDASITPSCGADQFGEVTDGTVRIACSALLAVVSVTGDDVYIQTSGREHCIRGSRDSTERFQSSGQDQSFLLPLVGIASDFGSHWTRGIIIRRTNRIQGEFRRVAALLGLADNAESDPLARAMKIQGQDTARAQCAEIIENVEHPEQCCVITIV